MRMRAFIDSGGSRTRLRLRIENSLSAREFGSINPASGAGSEKSLSALLDYIEAERQGRDVSILAGSSTIAPTTLVREVEAWDKLATRMQPGVSVLLFNDAVPLVMQGHCGQVGVVLGTGSCFLVQDGGSIRRFGGVEWLGSDEGGATHLGLLALRNLAQSSDGRRPWTRLHSMIEELFACDAQTLLRQMAESAHPKSVVAKLAPCVLSSAYEFGDENAVAIVDEALDAVDDYIRTIREVFGSLKVWRLTGGLLGNPGYLNAVVSRVIAMIPEADVSVIVEVADLIETMDPEQLLEVASVVETSQSGLVRGVW